MYFGCHLSPDIPHKSGCLPTWKGMGHAWRPSKKYICPEFPGRTSYGMTNTGDTDPLSEASEAAATVLSRGGKFRVNQTGFVWVELYLILPGGFKSLKPTALPTVPGLTPPGTSTGKPKHWRKRCSWCLDSTSCFSSLDHAMMKHLVMVLWIIIMRNI